MKASPPQSPEQFSDSKSLVSTQNDANPQAHEQELREEDHADNEKPKSPKIETLESSDLVELGQESGFSISQDQQQQLAEDPSVPGLEDQHNSPGMSRSSSLSLTVDPLAPDTHVVVLDTYPSAAPLPSPANPYRRSNKRKKGKVNLKKQQAIEKKLQILTENLNPIPFTPSKMLNFPMHEKLLKRLGLWDFVHVVYDGSIWGDLISQLIVTYDPKLRYSYVNDIRILVNRADLARALKLPVKKEKGVNAAEAMDLDSDAFSEESLSFVEDLVSNYVLLHEDMWMMPGEVMSWIQTIKEGNPDKVDWAGLVWFMVEKELAQGEHLRDCFYASHLQHLIKSQREELLREVPKMEMELDAEMKEKDADDGGVSQADENLVEDKVAIEETNIKLTLGQDVEDEAFVDEEMMDSKETKKDDLAQGFMNGENCEVKHFLQSCSQKDGCAVSSHERWKVEGDEEEKSEPKAEADNGFHIATDSDALEGEELTGNLLQGMEIPLSSGDFLLSRSGTHGVAVGPSSLGSFHKRQLKHDYDISHHSLNDCSKRVRTDGYLEDKPSDFKSCMEDIVQRVKWATIIYEDKVQGCEQLENNQHILLEEMNRHSSIINQLQKSRCAELQKKDAHIYRLERELFVMGNLLEGYRKALKETDKAFSEYRKCFQLQEEPIYMDAGPGGLMMSTAEMEKQREKQEEEERLNCLIMEQKFKEAEEDYMGKFQEFLDTVHLLNERLMGLENGFKSLKDSTDRPKVSEA